MSDTVRPQQQTERIPLPAPNLLRQESPVSVNGLKTVSESRDAVRRVMSHLDNRMLIIVGPCSIHDTTAALEYMTRLAELADSLSDKLLVVARAYFEKPRTTVGWRGLINDPRMDGTFDMAEGLRLARRLLVQITDMGLPVATELLQPMAAGYFDDLLAWAAIGARTTESQIHREMASGLGMPVGFKNGTDGGVAIACDAMRSASHPHRHFGVDSQGHPAIIQTPGNPDTHLVLRGGHRGPNYDAQSVAQIEGDLQRLNITSRIMVDCSHANSGKDPLRQPEVFANVLAQRLGGNRSLIGMMIESHLFEGCQPLGAHLRYGVSVTDGCLGWEATERLLRGASEQLRACARVANA